MFILSGFKLNFNPLTLNQISKRIILLTQHFITPYISILSVVTIFHSLMKVYPAQIFMVHCVKQLFYHNEPKV